MKGLLFSFSVFLSILIHLFVFGLFELPNVTPPEPDFKTLELSLTPSSPARVKIMQPSISPTPNRVQERNLPDPVRETVALPTPFGQAKVVAPKPTPDLRQDVIPQNRKQWNYAPQEILPVIIETEEPPSDAGAVEMQARPMQKLRFPYPMVSRERNEEGTVHCRISINAQGSVTSVSVIKSSGFPRLDRAAEEALLTAKFRPAMRDKIPVPSTLRIPVTFRLRGQ